MLMLLFTRLRSIDKTAKAAAEGEVQVLFTTQSQSLDKTVLSDMQNRSPQTEKDHWKRHGALLKEELYV